jgi:hypothetical protein
VLSGDGITRLVLGLGALLALGLLAGGCTSTQQKSARAKVVATRLLEARKPLLVTRQNPSVKVLATTLVGGRAVVVRLRNLEPRVAEDLPITVGIRRGRYLNRRGSGDYLQRHVPAIAAGTEATWVFTSARKIARRGTPFARVGASGATPPVALPAVRVSDVAARGSTVTARVTNSSAIPQYGLGVYAYALRAGRAVAAGRAVIGHLGTGAATVVRLEVVGSLRRAVLHVDAAPSTLR